jgi:hypothetical protein
MHMHIHKLMGGNHDVCRWDGLRCHDYITRLPSYRLPLRLRFAILLFIVSHTTCSHLIGHHQDCLLLCWRNLLFCPSVVIPSGCFPVGIVLLRYTCSVYGFLGLLIFLVRCMAVLNIFINAEALCVAVDRLRYLCCVEVPRSDRDNSTTFNAANRNGYYFSFYWEFCITSTNTSTDIFLRYSEIVWESFEHEVFLEDTHFIHWIVTSRELCDDTILYDLT